ncbi:MAG: Aspartate-semialdehyde dehydrogenase 2 [Alphaproteobacteria bacterium MarineAlpha10_Bin1]|nr:MAG: Aspartate-semialdehyde dehydrogenase 2 [Alphaproteobacteria bacterium MarineAlpha10_Bin1]
MGYRVAVVGATGNVGREIIKTLSERDFPADEVIALASRASVGKEISFGENKILEVQALEGFDFSGIDFGLFSPGASVSRVHAPRAADAGCVVIDNTSEFRMDEDVPLVVPEVNGHTIGDFRQRNIIANPNCSTIQMVMALKPLHDLVPIKRIVVATYQSVSGSGKAAMDELFDHTRAIFMNDRKTPELFPKTIAFNVIPHIDVFMPDGSTKEETKLLRETQKILDADIALSATCVRVPTFIGHAEALNIEFHDRLNEDEAREALAEAPGVVVLDERHDGGYVTPVDCAGEDATYVSRIRQDTSVQNGLNMWVVSDNLRKGAALNAVQIAEELAHNHMNSH